MYFFVEFNNGSKKIVTKEEKFEILKNHSAFSISKGYETIDKLYEGEQIQKEPCKCCGKIFRANYVEERKERMLQKHYCFNCDFWDEANKSKGNKRIIINGQKNSDGGWVGKNYEGFKGHGGHVFYIEWLESGEVFKTNNLWHQGEIPPEFKDKMPDNAKFITEEEYNDKTRK